MKYKIPFPNYEQGLLFDLPMQKKSARANRNNPLFLRNQFPGIGRYGIPIVKKQKINLTNVGLIACTNTTHDDREYFDFGVHFFVDDYDFGQPYEKPEKSCSLYSQYRFCLTPDYSIYGEMPTWRQLESVAHSRWCGAYWQANGMDVIPTVSWGKYHTFEFCFDGIEFGSIVAIATYACKMEGSKFLRGYDAMCERISPSAILCYGAPFPQMRGNIISITPCHPRCFHREI